MHCGGSPGYGVLKVEFYSDQRGQSLADHKLQPQRVTRPRKGWNPYHSAISAQVHSPDLRELWQNTQEKHPILKNFDAD